MLHSLEVAEPELEPKFFPPWDLAGEAGGEGWEGFWGSISSGVSGSRKVCDSVDT